MHLSNAHPGFLQDQPRRQEQLVDAGTVQGQVLSQQMLAKQTYFVARRVGIERTLAEHPMVHVFPDTLQGGQDLHLGPFKPHMANPASCAAVEDTAGDDLS